MFGKNLMVLRKKRGVSQEKLADELGVSRQTIYLWENGDSVPDANKLLALKQFFGVSIDGLISGESSTEACDNSIEQNKITYSNFYRNFAVAAVLMIMLFGSSVVWSLLLGNASGAMFPVQLSIVICLPVLIYFLSQVRSNKELARENWFTKIEKSNANKILVVKIAIGIGVFTTSTIPMASRLDYYGGLTPEDTVVLMTLMWAVLALILHGAIMRRKFVIKNHTGDA